MSEDHIRASSYTAAFDGDSGKYPGQEAQMNTSNESESSHHELPHSGNNRPIDSAQTQADSIDTERQSQPKSKSASFISEIRALRERLIHLEEEAGNQPSTDDVELGCDGDTEGAGASEEEKKLRKEIRRAHFARKWVQKTEKRADETADSREKSQFGQNPPFMYSIGPSGRECDPHFEYTSPKDDDVVSEFATERENLLWGDVETHPGRGSVRPQTSLRPIYSRKLGPHTQWDTSDSNEWSSDDTTRSRDFDYFRARLRGDFEWELDRLTHQRKRYEAHKEKKKARELADKAKMERRMQAQAAGPQDGDQDADAVDNEAVDDPGKEDKTSMQHAVPKLNPLEWDTFKAARITQPEGAYFSIDILIGEPKIFHDYPGFLGKTYWTKMARSRPISRVQRNSKHPDTAEQQAPTSTTRPDGHSPFPERIRIHSRHIIKTLSVIHGSELVSSDDFGTGSVVMLRPFRMLTYYEREIREWYSKLEEELHPTNTELDRAAEAEEPANTKDVDGTSEASSENEETSKVEDPQGYSKSETTLQQLPCLFDFMDRYISERVAYLNSARCNKIYFSDIWHVFKPGDIVISADGKQAYQVIKLTSPRHAVTQKFSAFFEKEREESNVSKQDITIHCVYIHFDGSQLGPVSHAFPIKKYDGERAVAALDIYPLRFHILKNLEARAAKSKLSGTELEDAVTKGVADLRQRLIQRGKLFVDVAGVKHMYYAGLTVDTRDEVESQVMIDFEEAFKNNPWRPTIERLLGATLNSEESDDESEDEGGNDRCKAICCQGENVHNDSYVEGKQQRDLMNSMMAEMAGNSLKLPSVAIFPRTLEEIKTDYNSLKDDELIIMSHRVFGFVLRDRTWAQLDVDYLSDVTDNSEGGISASGDDSDEEDQTAFGRLILPKGHRQMVLSLISQHFRNKASQKGRDEQVDIVRGKGKGLIILLHGAPGVGKTTTAEGVAEKFKKPLFQITCGDLGSNAKDVETALQVNFALANRWDCILLLDEADVFLAERRRDDFNRNALVAVFLRVLEYYAGILFLTTNRIGDFDEAFASRIHMSLHYPPLDRLSTTKVFKLNFAMIRARYQESGRKIKIDETEIIDMAVNYWQDHDKARWNGRQIRNACQTALALAEFDAQPEDSKYDLKVRSDAKVHLTVKSLQTVSDAYLEFMEYLHKVHGADAETHAKEMGLRALETVFGSFKTGKGNRSNASGRQDEESENDPYKFKLGRRSQAERNLGQPHYPQPQPHQAPQVQVQHTTLDLGRAGNEGDDPRTSIPPAGYSHFVPDPGYTTYLSPGTGPPRQYPGYPGTPSVATTTAGSMHHIPGMGYSMGQDPRTTGIPPPDRSDQTSQRAGPYGAAEIGQGNQPGLNPAVRNPDYNPRAAGGGYPYPPAGGQAQ
ncbi:Protein MSP1 [Fusarium sp. LHS14.1]|nr:Protein MSP1 [Fusarium sp. LHS14.1]